MPCMAAPATLAPAWTLVSLRPCGGHDALRRAAARAGARVLALSPWRLAASNDAATRARLAQVLALPAVVFTSPAAVVAAARLLPLAPALGDRALAVGAGTARALHRHGVAEVAYPTRMDSTGLLALPALANATAVGLVTAPGGRGLLADALAARGTPVVRGDVYRRVPVALAASRLERLARLHGPAVLAVSSGEALQRITAQVPAQALTRWKALPVVAASERLMLLARGLGFSDVHRADGPRPAQLVRAARARASAG